MSCSQKNYAKSVLCVIPTEEERRKVLEFAKNNTMAIVYITVYEGDKTGVGKKTRDGYQCNKRLGGYVDEVMSVFKKIEVYDHMILAYP